MLSAGRHDFYVDDIYLSSDISQASVLASPDWSSSEPLPLSFTEAERIARDELRKLVHNEPAWEVSSIALNRWPMEKWHYAITLFPKRREWLARPDSFTALVTLSGKPVVTGLPRSVGR